MQFAQNLDDISRCIVYMRSDEEKLATLIFSDYTLCEMKESDWSICTMWPVQMYIGWQVYIRCWHQQPIKMNVTWHI